MKLNYTRSICAVILTFLVNVSHGQTILYVDDDANALGDGKTWGTAYRYLQDALAEAKVLVTDQNSGGTTEPNTGGRSTRAVTKADSAGDPCTVEIRVAEGIYKPDCNEVRPEGSGDRDASFVLVEGVTLKGGFAGLTGVDPNVRDADLYRTVLSGDLAGDDLLVADPCDFVAEAGEGRWNRPKVWCLLIESTRRENCRHVVTTKGKGQGIILVGVTITGANAYKLPFTKGDMVSYDEEETGGGILNQAPYLTLRDCILVHNSCYGEGGGIYSAKDCNLVMEDCRLMENYGYASSGGIDCDEDGAISLIRCMFERNVVGYGPCTTISGRACTMALRDCTFVGNSDQDRGEPVLRCITGSLGLYHCVFRDNLGSTLFCSQVDGAVKDCLFQNNAGNYFHNSEIEVCQCFFNYNNADNGGAISSSSSSLMVTNTVFAGNRAVHQGGAIYSLAGRPIISNCTFLGNRAGVQGGAIKSDNSLLSIANCILWANEAPKGVMVGLHQFGDLQSSLEFSYNDIQFGQLGLSQDSKSTLIWGGGNIDVDPCFVNSGYWDANGTVTDANDDYFVAGDYHLKSQAGHWNPNSESWVPDEVTSPCIDAGDPNSAIGLEPFPNGGRINMGAYGGTCEASKSLFGGLACEASIKGDINGDCRVDYLDLALLARHWLG